ncbi:MAG TPA: S8 family serine peptidase [Acidimicrobiales bacterium]|nr:S8 family serine peptidase [Acidimicrobiales bacterium]
MHSGVLREYESVPLLAVEVTPEGVERLRRSSRVAAVEEDVADPPTLAESAAIVGADLVWDDGFDGGGTTVAVLDTGVQKGHDFFGGRVTDEACFSDGDCPNGRARQVGSGSGAPCSYPPGAIMGRTCRHRRRAGREPLRGRSGGRRHVGPGLQQDERRPEELPVGSDRRPEARLPAPAGRCRRRRRQHEPRRREVRLQLCDDTRKPAIDNLRSVGVATVVSSGNDGYNDAISAPACISGAVSVGATTNGDEVISFSNSGPALLLLAPGVDITSSVPGGGFATKSGTSMAAPHVTGAWAVLKSAVPGAGVGEILESLVDTGERVSG